MIFIITENIVNNDDKYFLKCFENLLLAYIEGFHLLYIKPKVFNLIEKKYLNLMDDRMKSQLLHYKNNFMLEIKGIINLVNYSIELIPTSEQEYFTIDKGFLYTHNFLSSSNIQKTTLLCENLDDCDIYRIIGENYIKKKNSNLTVNLKPENGGGNTTSKIFKRKISNNEEFCLCFLDSDKKHHSDNLGETAKKVKKDTKNRLTPKYNFYIEEKARELENILFGKFYQQKYSSTPEKKEFFNQIKFENNLFYYLDMKEGLTHFEYLKIPFIKESLEEIQIDCKKRVCTNSTCEKKATCSYKIINGFGTKILEDFISEVKNNNFNFEEAYNSSPKELKEIWDKIGQLVFSWTCGQKKLVYN